LIKKKKCGVKTLGGESLSNQLDRDRRIIFAYEVPVVCIPTTYTDNDTDFRAWRSVEQWQYLLTQKLIKSTWFANTSMT